MEHGACEPRASKLKKIGNYYEFPNFFSNFVGKKEEKCLILTYYRVPYNCGLYENLFLIGEQLHYLPYFFPRGYESQAPPVNTNSSTNFAEGGNSITHHIFFPIGCESQVAPMNTNSFTNFKGGQLHHSPYFCPNTKSLEYKVHMT